MLRILRKCIVTTIRLNNQLDLLNSAPYSTVQSSHSVSSFAENPIYIIISVRTADNDRSHEIDLLTHEQTVVFARKYAFFVQKSHSHSPSS